MKHLTSSRARASLGASLGAALGPILGLLVLATAAGAQTVSHPDAAPGSTVAAGGEAIRPGDVVRLSVLRDEDLSGDFPVNQFGTVVLPLVGEYDVTRETHRTLRDRVIRDLREIRFVPDVELVVLKRVRVVGEVNEPGVYPLDPTMTVADAVATAKGRTQFASEGTVILRRGAEVVDADLRLDAPLSESLIESGDEIFVPRRSWVDRNLGAVVAGASTIAGVMITLLLR